MNISTKEEFVERMPENAAHTAFLGKPANKEILTKMAGEDVTEMKSELLEIKVLDVMSDRAYAVIIAKASFDYKGTKNEDIYTQSLLYKKKRRWLGIGVGAPINRERIRSGHAGAAGREFRSR